MGGPGSGRHEDPIKRILGNQPVTGIDTQGFVLTNLSGVQTGALKTSPPILPNRIVYASNFGSLQAAIDSVASSGGMVILSPGTYTITTSLLIPDNIMLAGSGFGNTTIRGTLSDYMIKSPDTSVRYFNWQISDLFIWNEGTGGGVELKNVTLAYLEGVKIQCSGTCVNMDGTLGCFYNVLDKCDFRSGSIGVNFVTTANENRIVNSRTNGVTTAVDIDSTCNQIFIAGLAIENATNGIFVGGANATIIHTRLEQVSSTGITIESTAVGATVIGTHISTAPALTDATQGAIVLDQGRVTMSGAMFLGTTAPTFAQTVASGATFVSGGALWFKGSTTQTQLAPA